MSLRKACIDLMCNTLLTKRYTLFPSLSLFFSLRLLYSWNVVYRTVNITYFQFVAKQWRILTYGGNVGENEADKPAAKEHLTKLIAMSIKSDDLSAKQSSFVNSEAHLFSLQHGHPLPFGITSRGKISRIVCWSSCFVDDIIKVCRVRDYTLVSSTMFEIHFYIKDIPFLCSSRSSFSLCISSCVSVTHFIIMMTKQRDIVVSTLMIPRPRESDEASFEAVKKKRERKRGKKVAIPRCVFVGVCVGDIPILIPRSRETRDKPASDVLPSPLPLPLRWRNSFHPPRAVSAFRNT